MAQVPDQASKKRRARSNDQIKYAPLQIELRGRVGMVVAFTDPGRGRSSRGRASRPCRPRMVAPSVRPCSMEAVMNPNGRSKRRKGPIRTFRCPLFVRIQGALALLVSARGSPEVRRRQLARRARHGSSVPLALPTVSVARGSCAAVCHGAAGCLGRVSLT